MGTRFRRDLTSRDFEVARAFKRGMHVLRQYVEGAGITSPWPIEVSRVEADSLTKDYNPIPKVASWYFTAGGKWKINDLSCVQQNYMIMDKSSLRRICGFIHIKESEVLHVLFRMSILAAHGSISKPLFRFPIKGVEYYLLEYKRLSQQGHIANLPSK